MRFYVATWTRVGSTWVSEILSHLMETGERYKFQPSGRQIEDILTDEEFEELDSVGHGVFKSHQYPPVSLTKLAEGDSYVVTVTRNFKDAFVSKALYERYTRPSQDLPIGQPYRGILERYPDIPDSAFIELLIETRLEWVDRQIFEWVVMTHKVMGTNHIMIDYDKYTGRTKELVQRLNRYVKAPGDVVRATIEECSLQRMQERDGQTQFVRKGQVGNWKRYIDESTSALLQQRINQYIDKGITELI